MQLNNSPICWKWGGLTLLTGRGWLSLPEAENFGFQSSDCPAMVETCALAAFWLPHCPFVKSCIEMNATYSNLKYFYAAVGWQSSVQLIRYTSASDFLVQILVLIALIQPHVSSNLKRFNKSFIWLTLQNNSHKHQSNE